MICRAHVPVAASLARRLGVAVALVAAAWTAGAVVPTEAAAASCGPAPSGKVAVHVVVDRGSGSPVRHCVVLGSSGRPTGLTALQANHAVRLEGGFVCAIGGLPATGCATQFSQGAAYWSYWHAPPGGTWTYSQTGAGGRYLVAPCSVEGWTWSSSPGAARPPRVDPRTLDCNPAPPPTSAPPPPTSPPASGSVGSNGQVGGDADPSRPPNTTGPTGTDGAQRGGPTTSTEPAEDQPAATAPGDEGPDANDNDDAGAAEGSDPDAAEDERGADGRADSDGDRSGDVGEGTGELASAPGAGGSGGPPWGVLVAGVLVLTLGGAAAVRSRRREAPAA